MAELRAATRRTDTQARSARTLSDDPRWRNDASFNLLVVALLLMVLTLVFWVG